MADVTYSFSGRDFSAELERLNTLLTGELPEMTDRNHSDVGQVILRLLARETDQLNSYIDQVFAEGFLATARFKQSLIDLGILVGYLPTLATGAAVTLTLARVSGIQGQIDIPQYTAFARKDGLDYLTLEDTSILSNENTVDVEAMQGTLVTMTIQEGDWDVTDWSGRPRINLGLGVVASTFVGSYGETPTYLTQVESFWRSLPTDDHCWLELNGDTDEVWLVLGDGTQGAGIPATDLTVKFINTDGATGNCGAATIYNPSGDFGSQVTCTNAESATGGGPIQTTASIRQNLPAVVRTQRRGVTKEDYEALVEHITGVQDCQVLDRNDSAPALTLAMWGSSVGGFPHRYLVLIVLPVGGGTISTNLKNTIWAECAAWGHLGAWQDRYLLWSAIEVPLSISVKIGLAPGSNENTVITNVTTALSTMLSAANREIGGTLTFNELYQTVNAVAGVSWCEFTTPTDSVEVENGQILTAGTMTVTVP